MVEVVDGMLAALGEGKTVVDCSTIDPEVERAQHVRVAGRGARYLDAPLSGGTAGARNGVLTLMVGGDAATLEDVTPALTAFAGLIVHVGGPGMGQVVKLCNNLIYAAQMTATAEATALAVKSGVDMHKLFEVLTHATGDCVAVRTRLPVAGVVPESPASHDWQPGFMTDLMAKDLDLALAYAATARRPPGHDGDGSPDAHGGAERRVRPRGLLGRGQGRPGVGRSRMTRPGRLPIPAVILAADHRARGVVTIENYGDYVEALVRALPLCDGILATAQPLADLADGGSSRPRATAPTSR